MAQPRRFEFPVLKFAELGLGPGFVELVPGCVDVAAVRGEAPAMDTLFAHMQAWLMEPDTLEDAAAAENEMVVLRTECEGWAVVIAFDLGGCDDAAFELQEAADELDLSQEDVYVRSHARPGDIRDFCCTAPARAQR